MITANELLKGNYLIYHETDEGNAIATIDTTDIDSIDNNPEYAALHSPVPLTVDLLRKAGFVEKIYDGLSWYEHPYQKNGFSFFTGDKNRCMEVVIEFHNEELKRLRYLHQLQNLFYFLTGEELTVEL